MIFAVGSDGAVIRNNVIRPVGRDTLGGCGYEVGVRVLAGSGITVRDNVIRNFTGAGVFGNGDPGIRVVDNPIQYHHSAEALPIQPRANGISLVGGSLVWCGATDCWVCRPQA